MFIQLFSKTMVQLQKALDIRSARHSVITANIANQDTPGYKAKSLDFKKTLSEVSNKTDPTIRLKKTDAAHLSSPLSSASSIHSQVTLSTSGESRRLDENTVNGEREMARLAENTFMYRATAQLIASKFRGIKNVINEGR